MVEGEWCVWRVKLRWRSDSWKCSLLGYWCWRECADVYVSVRGGRVGRCVSVDMLALRSYVDGKQ